MWLVSQLGPKDILEQYSLPHLIDIMDDNPYKEEWKEVKEAVHRWWKDSIEEEAAAKSTLSSCTGNLCLDQLTSYGAHAPQTPASYVMLLSKQECFVEFTSYRVQDMHSTTQATKHVKCAKMAMRIWCIF